MSDERPDYPPPDAGDRARPAPVQAPPSPTPPPRPGGGGHFSRGFGLGTGFGLGLGIAMIVTVAVTGALMIVGSLALVGTATGTATTALSTVWGGGSQVLRAVPVSGTILAGSSDGALLSAGTYGYEVADQLDSLTAEDASGVVLLVNTPGGTIAGSRAIGDAVERYRERTGQPVLVHVTSMSASGGVYATASADEIIADHGSMIGSIGVIFGPFQYYDGVVATSGSLLESGVTTTGGISSEYLTEGEGKDFGNPYRPMTDEERDIYQENLATEYDAFVSYVSDHRGIDAATIRESMGAHLYGTDRAEEFGLIDAVMGRDEFFRHAAEAAGLDPDDTRVEAIRPPSVLEVWLGVERPFGVAPAVVQGAGVRPEVSAGFCGASQPLAYAGDSSTVCG